jgi:hypothetical protein
MTSKKFKNLLDKIGTELKQTKKIKTKEFSKEDREKLTNRVKECLKNTGVNQNSSEISLERLNNYILTTLEIDLERLEKTEKKLNFIKEFNYNSFDIEQLPDIIKSITYYVRLLPETEYPNSLAVSTATFSATHVIGQLKPKINSNIYSPDILGINLYLFLIAPSGS